MFNYSKIWFPIDHIFMLKAWHESQILNNFFWWYLNVQAGHGGMGNTRHMWTHLPRRSQLPTSWSNKIKAAPILDKHCICIFTTKYFQKYWNTVILPYFKFTHLLPLLYSVERKSAKSNLLVLILKYWPWIGFHLEKWFEIREASEQDFRCKKKAAWMVWRCEKCADR